MEQFEIALKTWDAARKIGGHYKFTVEMFYQSEQIERYKLIGGNKEMILEKNLLIKSSLFKNWKITSANFAMDVVNESTVMTLIDIYKKIDDHRNGVKSIAWQRTEH